MLSSDNNHDFSSILKFLSYIMLILFFIGRMIFGSKNIDIIHDDRKVPAQI